LRKDLVIVKNISVSVTILLDHRKLMVDMALLLVVFLQNLTFGM